MLHFQHIKQLTLCTLLTATLLSTSLLTSRGGQYFGRADQPSPPTQPTGPCK